MAVSTWSYFWLLMWKNFLIKFRHKVEFLIEIIIPVAFSCVILAIRGIAYPEVINTPTTYTPNAVNNLNSIYPLFLSNEISAWEIDYTPNHSRLHNLMLNAALSMVVSPLQQRVMVRGFDTPDALERYLLTNKSIAGVVFDVDEKELDQDYPKNLKFSLRFPAGIRSNKTFGQTATWMTKKLFPMQFTQGPRNKNRNDGGIPPGYIPEGFATIQNMISSSYIKMKSGSAEVPNVQLQRFPFKPYVDDPIINALEIMVAFMVLLSFVYPCIQAVKHVTIEKETQLKEAMKIMGLSTALHWSAWFFTLWLCLLITAILTVVIFKVPWFDGFTLAVFSHSSASLLLVFFVIYVMGLVTFSFMISTFFTKANVAGAIGGLAWFAIYIPYTFTIYNFVYMSVETKLGFSLFLNTALGFGFKIMLNWEATTVGAQWSNLFDTVTIEENLTLGHIMLMMIVDSVLYLLIALYVEKVMPGSYGRTYKWYFPLMPGYWFPRKKAKYVDVEGSANQSDRFESEAGCGKAGVKLLNLKKKFGGKYAVDGISLNMFNDQITVLLGHNGAGKTTTISMITGLISPTSGTAIVNGVDIQDDIGAVRKSFGFCPQYNILFSELTVREHIIFYSRLKGLNKTEIEEEIDKYLKVLDFEDKRNAQAKTLSGGMKRKLSVGVALCGGSKVILCDEPSSGMDPSARRSLWDLILAEKKGRTILLTTHFMDEADVLGDRIAIMSGGKLQCSGTPFFLKKRFGTGYQLTCSKQEFCKSEHVTELIRKYIPDIQVKSDVGTELSYDLSEKYASAFEQMLKEFEDQQQVLRINGFGISMSTLEDVFMKTGSDIMGEADNQDDSNNGSIASINGFRDSVVIVDEKTDNIDIVGPKKRTEYQWRAMFLKKIYNLKHNWHIFLIQLMVPLVLTIISIYIPKMETQDDLPPININLDDYGSTITLLENQGNNDLARSYEKMFSEFGPNKRLDSVTSMSMSDMIIDLQKKDLLRVNTRYMVAATISNNISIGWFNNEGLHTVPLTLNLIYNAIVKARFGDDHSIEVTNDPLPFSIDLQLEKLNLTGNLGFQLGLNITFAMAFVSGIFILYMIKERVSKAKLLQFVSGVRLLTFWFMHYIWDFFLSIIISAALTILLLIYQQDGFSTSDELGRVFLLFIAYAFGSLPLMYLISLLYDDPATGMSRLVMIHIFTGNALFMTAFVLSSDLIGDGDDGEIVKIIGLFFPGFTLSQGLVNQAKVSTLEGICNQFADLSQQTVEYLCTSGLLTQCCDLDAFAWTEPGITREIVALIVVGVVLFGLLLLIENRSYFLSLVNIKSSITNLPPLSEDGFIDSDVQKEKDNVSQMTVQELPTHNLVMRDVTKYYKKFLAVNQLSVTIDKGECFGLLGVNGAGKTSTFKMLTGDESISHGNIWVKGYNTIADKFAVYEMIGYCPQFDGLLEDLTGNEILRIYCLLRGVPSHLINSLINRIAKDLAFDKYLNKRAMNYSGGNKRKLSTAVAILGNPNVVYLDEPTTGIDPASRRKLWDLVCNVRDMGKAIVLTSHSMEECEALCTRIAIMVNGEFKCIGSTQHLKNKFAQSISLTIKLEPEPESNDKRPGHNRAPSTLSASAFQINEYGSRVQQFISEHFHGAEMRSFHKSYLTFEIPINVMPYSRIFGLMESHKKALHIEDYSISQASLEQIFLNFAQKQRTEEENQMLRKRKKNKKTTANGST